MIVKVDISNLKETRWYQYAVRFLLGGLITAVAGLIAKKFGAPLGGLFLAFPAILPASATLIEKTESERKQEVGLNGIQRARQAVAADAAGAELGALALILFAFIVWRMLPNHAAWETILSATVAWLVAAIALWFARKRHILRKILPTGQPGQKQDREGHALNRAGKGSKGIRL